MVPGAKVPSTWKVTGLFTIALGSAVAEGCRVVVARDAVAGAPAEYGTAVIENSPSLLATVTTTEEPLATGRAS